MTKMKSLKDLTYPISNKCAYYTLATLDWFLKALPLQKNFVIPPPKKILLINLAHLGDVILTTTLLQPIKDAFAHVEIGMLIGTWSKVVINNHPMIDHIHYLNHWKVNRKKENSYLKMRKSVKQEISHYDVAIDCSFHFPNTALLLWQAQIPTRIGFTSAGFGPLLTHSLPWHAKNQSAALSFFQLLNFLGIHGAPSKPILPAVTSTTHEYTVIHMGAGHPRKKWHRTKWRELAKRLDHHRLIFTGIGEVENADIEWVIQGLPHAHNYCNKLSWNEFVSCIKGADLLLSVDTSAGHIASAFDTPAVLLFTGINPIEIWRPFGDHIHIITNPVSCSPCFQGCASLACIKGISVETVVKSINALPTVPASSCSMS